MPYLIGISGEVRQNDDMNADVDVAIVGAGVAGIAAARRLRDTGHSVLLVEALPRLGGRAHTETIAGLPLDLGCGWLHSAERNPLADLAEATGVQILRGETAWRRQFRNIAFSQSEQHEAWEAFAKFEERLRRDPPPSDRAGDALDRGDRWRPFLDALSSYMNGVELDRLSVADFLAYEDHATDHNWRLPDGYGAFIANLASDLPVSLETRVSTIRHDARVVLETNRGTIQARAAIVTASTTMLASNTIRFDPPVDDHLHAAAGLPLGLADKVFLEMADPGVVPAESHLVGSIDSAATGSHYIRPFGRPIVETFIGGEHARALEEADAAAFAIDELRALLGADFARGLTPIATTRWAAEPTIGGSYSHALPGRASARAMLAAPISERLCFAGEGCSPTDFSTAHGAWKSGLAAGQWIEQWI
jgi:monoamine oxidase